MPPRKPAPARRREIAAAALRVIAGEGVGRFTAVAVAREVGVSDAALFRHFASMGDIVLAAIDRVEEILFEGFPPAGADPLDRLGAFFRHRVEVIRANPGVARLVGSEALAQVAPPEGVARVEGFRRRSRDFVRRALADADRAGLLAAGVGVEEAAVLVLGALLALAHGGADARATGALAARTWTALERLLRRAGTGARGSLPAPERARARG